MNIREMITLLCRYPDDLRVVVNGYEDGYDDLSPCQISVVPIALDTGVHDWEELHGDPRDVPPDTSQALKIVDALVLRRTSN